MTIFYSAHASKNQFKQLRNAFRLALLGLGFGLLAQTYAQAQETMDRTQVEKIVREYLLENPEILFELQQALEDKQQAEIAANQQRTIAENQDAIYNGPFQIEFGNPDADVTVVEFFDYNCGFCQRAMADMQQILETDDNVRFVLKEFPVLGEQSMEAARVSMAFSRLKPELHGEFHMQLLGTQGVKDAATAIAIATSLGADEAELIKGMENPEIVEAISQVYQLAEGLGVTGTPSYVVGKKVVFGAVGYEELKREMAASQE